VPEAAVDEHRDPRADSRMSTRRRPFPLDTGWSVNVGWNLDLARFA
jgi:hypothetical protein